MTKKQVRKQVQKKIKEIAGIYEEVPGWIGASESSITPGISGLIYVRLINGQIVIAVNNGIAPEIYDYPVIVSKQDNNNYWKILRVSQYYATPLQSVGFHHSQHEYPGPDTIFVRDAQFTPLLVLPYYGLQVNVYGGIIRQSGKIYVVNNQVLNLSSYVPSSGAMWAVIEAIEGGLEVKLSNRYNSVELLSYNNIVLGKGYALCAVRLYYGQTEIRRDSSVNDFVDLRLFSSSEFENVEFQNTRYVDKYADFKMARSIKSNKVFQNTNFI